MVKRLIPLLTLVMLVFAAACQGTGGQAPAPTAVTGAATPTRAAAAQPTAAAGTTPTAATAGTTPTAAAGTINAPAGSRLARIIERGKIIIGVKYDVPLFGFLNPTTRQLEGFDVAVGKEIAKKIFGDASKVEFKEAKSANRIPMLQSDEADLVISTMTITEQRKQEIDFSDVYYLAGQSLLVPKDSTIKGINDLAGKKVGTAKGSTSEKNIREKAPQADVVLFDTYSEALTAMQNKRLDAITTDDIILFGLATTDPNVVLVGGTFTQEPYGIGIKKGQPELVQLVNSVVSEIKTNGRWKEIYKEEILNKLPQLGTTAPEPPK